MSFLCRASFGEALDETVSQLFAAVIQTEKTPLPIPMLFLRSFLWLSDFYDQVVNLAHKILKIANVLLSLFIQLFIIYNPVSMDQDIS